MMMKDVLPDVASLFNLAGAISFSLGVIACRVYYFVVDKVNDHKHPESAPHSRRWKSVMMAWVLVGIVVAYTFIETHNAYALTKQTDARATALAQEVKDCQNDFNASLKARSDATVQEAHLNIAERKALEDWVNALFNPPDDLRAFSLATPQREAYVEGVTAVYNQRVAALESAQDQVNAVRDNNQLPDQNTCGK